MGKIYVGQTALKFRLNTEIDLTIGVTSVKIKYTKPNDETVYQWDATAEEKFYAVYVVTAGDIDTEGTWTLWAYVNFSDGTSAPGEPDTKKVYTEGR
jgi:hypothetical protein